MRGLRLAVLLGGVLLLATACPAEDAPEGPLSGVSITFSVSLAEEEEDTVQELVDRFEQNTGADVSVTSIEADNLPERLRVDAQAGEPTIHLFAQDNLALRVLVDGDLVDDLSDVQVPGGVIEAMVPEQFDGTQYFLPFRPNVRITYVNTERFEEAELEPPTTVEELISVAETLRDGADGEGRVTLSLAEGDPAAVTLSEWIVGYGGDPLVLNDEGSVEAFTTLQEMWNDDLLARESLTARFDTEVDNLRGEVAYLAQNWPFTSGVFDEEGILDQFQVYEGWEFPERRAHVIGGDVLGIPRGVTGQQREAAVQLAEFLMSREAQELLAERNAWPSIREDAYAQVPAELQETFDAIQGALEGGWYRPNVAYWPEVSDAMNDAFRRIVQENQDPQTVLDEMHERVAEAAEEAGAEYPPTNDG